MRRAYNWIMPTHLSRRSIVNMLADMAAGPSPAECSRIEAHPPSSPTTICTMHIIEHTSNNIIGQNVHFNYIMYVMCKVWICAILGLHT